MRATFIGTGGEGSGQGLGARQARGCPRRWRRISLGLQPGAVRSRLTVASLFVFLSSHARSRKARRTDEWRLLICVVSECGRAEVCFCGSTPSISWRSGLCGRFSAEQLVCLLGFLAKSACIFLLFHSVESNKDILASVRDDVLRIWHSQALCSFVSPVTWVMTGRYTKQARDGRDTGRTEESAERSASALGGCTVRGETNGCYPWGSAYIICDTYCSFLRYFFSRADFSQPLPHPSHRFSSSMIRCRKLSVPCSVCTTSLASPLVVSGTEQ